MNGEKERNVSGKYVEKMFNLKKILVSVAFNLVCFCGRCREPGICFT